MTADRNEPLIINTLAQFRDHNMEITAHFRCGHVTLLDLYALIAEHGPDTQPDYAFKAALRCPHCGTLGAGISIGSNG